MEKYELKYNPSTISFTFDVGGGNYLEKIDAYDAKVSAEVSGGVISGTM